MNIETINMINNTSYLAKSYYYFIRVLKDYVEKVHKLVIYANILWILVFLPEWNKSTNCN